jgi:hypothetical protein
LPFVVFDGSPCGEQLSSQFIKRSDATGGCQKCGDLVTESIKFRISPPPVACDFDRVSDCAARSSNCGGDLSGARPRRRVLIDAEIVSQNPVFLALVAGRSAW